MRTFFHSKAGVELTLNTVITAILVIAVLLIVLVMLSKYGGSLLDALKERASVAIDLSKSADIKP